MRHQPLFTDHPSYQRHQAAMITVARFLGAKPEAVLRALAPRIKSQRPAAPVHHGDAIYTVSRFVGMTTREVADRLDRTRRSAAGKHGRYPLAA